MITYNKYIDKIGIEFEGYWRNSVFSTIVSKFPNLKETHPDGSLVNNYYGFSPYELTTNPCDAPALSQSLDFVKEKAQKGHVLIDGSVGLHFHISFTDRIYGSLCTKEFYDFYLDKFKSWFPAVFEERKEKHHCRASLEEGRPARSMFTLESPYYASLVYGGEREEPKEKKYNHFTRQSRDRYHFINYQIREWKTVEFRGYGGSHATIEGLTECIQKTIDSIAEFISSYKGKEEVIQIKAEDKKTHKKYTKKIGYPFGVDEEMRYAPFPTQAMRYPVNPYVPHPGPFGGEFVTSASTTTATTTHSYEDQSYEEALRRLQREQEQQLSNMQREQLNRLRTGAVQVRGTHVARTFRTQR